SGLNCKSIKASSWQRCSPCEKCRDMVVAAACPFTSKKLECGECHLTCGFQIKLGSQCRSGAELKEVWDRCYRARVTNSLFRRKENDRPKVGVRSMGLFSLDFSSVVLVPTF